MNLDADGKMVQTKTTQYELNKKKCVKFDPFWFTTEAPGVPKPKPEPQPNLPAFCNYPASALLSSQRHVTCTVSLDLVSGRCDVEAAVQHCVGCRPDVASD